MPSAEFSLHLDASEIERYYRGKAKSILVNSSTGLKVQFPANLILPYVARDGVNGRFLLMYDQNGKALSLKRM